MEGPAPEPGAGLQLGEDQRGRDQGIRDVRGDVDLQPVQSEQPAGDPAKRQVEPVERQTPDEDADADSRGFAARARTLGAKAVKRPSNGCVHRIAPISSGFHTPVWAQAFISKPVKKPLTAETAETAEKKTLRTLGVLCVLRGKTAQAL